MNKMPERNPQNPKVPVNLKSAKPRSTEVVHVKSGAFNNNDPTHIYVGRRNGDYPHSIWANPFKMDTKRTVHNKDGTASSEVTIKRDGSREEVIQKYKEWIVTQPTLVSQIPDLKGKRLGCWCHPSPCHADVLKELADAT